MEEFKLRKLSLDRATCFKVYYCKCAAGETTALMREFKSLKSMNQWIDRSDMEFGFMIFARYALIDNGWECFVTVGNRNITLSELDTIVYREKEVISDFNLPPFSSRVKEEEPQKSKNEEGESSNRKP
jgi:hypothetical protein